VFHHAYRTPEIDASNKIFKNLRGIDGLAVLDRRVVLREENSSLVQLMPELEYSVLMPWMHGDTWWSYLQTKKPFDTGMQIEIVRKVVQVLRTMEQRSLAHCDIAGSNVIISTEPPRVELVDIEDLYGPNLIRPSAMLSGTDGYAFKRNGRTLDWAPEADRFAGAILLTELLIWHNDEARQKATDQSFFSQTELDMMEQSEPYRLAHQILRSDYSSGLADLFERAWNVRFLSECPRLEEWFSAIEATLSPGGIPSRLAEIPIQTTQTETTPSPIAHSPIQWGPVTARPVSESKPAQPIPPSHSPAPTYTPTPLTPPAPPRRAFAFEPTPGEATALIIGVLVTAVFLCIIFTPTFWQNRGLQGLWTVFPTAAVVPTILHSTFRKKWITFVGYAATVFIAGLVTQSRTTGLTQAYTSNLLLGTLVSGIVLVALLAATEGQTNHGANRTADLVLSSLISTATFVALYLIVFRYISLGTLIAPLVAAVGWWIGDFLLSKFIAQRESH
jgi:tRNA A-37 threonylcarbamoyl transferase component Bud32/cell division septation protein DedD